MGGKGKKDKPLKLTPIQVEAILAVGLKERKLSSLKPRVTAKRGLTGLTKKGLLEYVRDNTGKKPKTKGCKLTKEGRKEFKRLNQFSFLRGVWVGGANKYQIETASHGGDDEHPADGQPANPVPDPA